ncbi:DUF3300 domain-containing protein [Terriglobus sp. TAA 43]|uniref:DUF3300 domain-containing protein n=1 Tax=Terriglobus sp. TAA 43 TaxID=278961 RepID=UPI000648B863|nr:DUF3300 domain-containing protein [Terriglobus sp. TAA 43]
MVRSCFKQFLAVVLSLLLVFPASEMQALAQQQAPAPAADSGQEPAPLSAAELEQVLAPIALYPDALVAQVLGAATFPDQVTAASDWLQQNKNLTGTSLAQAVDKQPWDPSVKALTQFPSVLDNMVKNLSWTSSLGEAYHTQPTQVMTAIQSLRAKAKAAGNLKTGSQITVVQQSPDVIVIQPTNPQVVYVPQYNPTVVYGAPVQTPGYSTAAVVGTALLAFGVGIAVGAAINNNCCGWGYSYWNCNWHGGGVVYRNNVYYGNRAWRGGAYGSSVTAYGRYGSATAARAYNPNTGTYARGAAVSTPYGARAAGQAYNPYTGTAARGGAVAGPNGAAAAGQAYNARTGTYASTRQTASAYGNAGSSTVSRNGQTTYTQHASNANGTVAAAENSRGGAAVAGTGARGNSAAAVRTANGNSAVNVNGHVYTNNGGSRGYGAQQRSGGAFGGGGSGWEARQASARGSVSRGGGGFRGRR